MKITARTIFGMLGLLSLLLTADVHAALTPAGTVITNTATLDYKDLGGNAFAQKTATVDVTVDKVGGVELAVVPQTKTIADSSWATYFVHVTNTGNDANETIELAFSSAHSASPGWVFKVYEDGGTTGAFSATDDILIASSPKTYLDVPMGTSNYLVVRVFAPAGTPDNTTDVVTLTASTTHTGATAVNEQDEATGTLTTTVKKPFSFSKTVDAATPAPGATVTYTLSYTNRLDEAIDDVSLKDYLPEALGTPGDLGTGSWNDGTRTITWTIGTVAAGATATVTFTAVVDAGASASDIITNNALLLYTNPGGGSRHFASSKAITVSGVRSWTITISPAIDSINVGMSDLEVAAQKHYLITLTNTGNGPDAAKIGLASSTQSLPWKLYADAGVSGTYESGSDNAEYTYGNSTGDVARNASVSFWAIATCPQGKTDGSTDVATYTATSSDGAITASGSKTTTTHIKAPIMTFQKSVSKITGDAKPGSILEYLIHYTNTGTGAANSIVISDASPSNTTYVPGSVKISWDNETFTSHTAPVGGIISWEVGTVSGKNAAGDADVTKKEGWLKFQVTINQ